MTTTIFPRCPHCRETMSPMDHGRCTHCGRHCGCSFAPESMSDYCDTHRPAPRREDAAGERLAQIAARLNAATPGPWAWANTCEKGYGANVGAGCFGEDDPNCTQPLSGDLTDSGEYYVDQPIAQLDHQKAAADAQFIAHSRSDVEYLLAALSTAERERDELHQQLGSAIDVARETMTEITTGRLASIGGIENTYCPQISVSRIKKLHERLVALADSYRARVPSGGEEGR